MIPTALVITAFLGISLLASIASSRTKTPYTILLVIIGLVVAATRDPLLSPFASTFTTDIGGGTLVGIILPPLLFESMLSIKVEEFRAVSRPALALATFGVVIATVVGGFIMWHFVGLSFYSAFIFAAIVAPTDVATVLEIFGRTAVPSRLATLLETEAVFNDATGIAIFTAILTSFGASSLSLVGAAGDFILIFGGGVMVGLVVAWGARQLQRGVSDPVTQIVLTMAAVYGAYGLAEALGVSGLIAVAVAGLFYGNTVLFRIGNREVERATREFWKILAFIANTAAFLYIGLSTDVLGIAGSAEAIVIAYLVVSVARFSVVYPILSLPGLGRRAFPWSWKNVAMLGGMRGALSIALVTTLPASLAGRSTVTDMTFGVAVISILLQGPILTRYVRRAFGAQETLGASQGGSGPPQVQLHST